MPNLYLGGSWASARAGVIRDIVNPWDQSVVAKVDEAGPEDVATAIAAARHAFDAGLWPHTPAAERGVLLGKGAGLLVRDREEIARIETLAHNEIGQHLYPSLGFEEVARQVHFAMDLTNSAEPAPERDSLSDWPRRPPVDGR